MTEIYNTSHPINHVMINNNGQSCDRNRKTRLVSSLGEEEQPQQSTESHVGIAIQGMHTTNSHQVSNNNKSNKSNED